jgi:hypothetical protein
MVFGLCLRLLHEHAPQPGGFGRGSYMKYDILWSTNLNELVKEVNDAISKGWEPIGGVCLADVAFYQSMVLK